MYRRFMFASFAATMLAGCAATTPAPVVGRFEREQGGRVASSTQSGKFTDRVSARAGGQNNSQTYQTTNTASSTRVATRPAVQTEDLTAIEPAAGPTQRQVASYNKPKTSYGQTPTQVNAMQAYTVKAGDTVFSLSRQFNTKPSAILQANGLESGALLETGMELAIPAGSGRLPATAGLGNGLLFNKQQTVAETEKFENIEPAAGPVEATPAPNNKVLKGPSGQRYRMINHNGKQVRVEDVAAVNLGAEPAAGRAPHATTEATPAFQNHTVQAGETIYRIAKTYHSSVLDMMVANEFDTPQQLQAGSIVKVPLKPVDVAQKPATNILKSAGLKTESALEETRRLMQETEARKPETIAQKSAEITPPKQPTQQPEVAVAEEAENVVISKTSVAKAAVAEVNAKRGQIDKIAAKTRGLAWPVRGGDIIRTFGQQGDGVAHTGINISVPAGTAVLAADGGKVLYADGGLKTYGNLVLVQHSNGMVTAYAHNNALLVNKGERVKKGQVIALSGNSGNVDKPQLHFEIRRNAQAVDPMRVLASR